MKTISNIGISVLFSFLMFGTIGCSTTEKKEVQQDVQPEVQIETTVPEEDKKVKININASENEIGVETDKVDFDMKGEDDKKKE